MHHLSQRITGGYISIFQSAGSITVAAFMLLSGYGEAVSYKKRDNINWRWFLGKIIKLLYPWLVCFLLKRIGSFIPGQPIWDFTISWFILAMIYLYVSFAVGYKNKLPIWFKNVIVVSMCIVWMIVILYMINGGYTSLKMVSKVGWRWVWPVFAFPLGLVWGNYRELINRFINNRLISFGIVFVGIIVLNICLRHFETVWYGLFADITFCIICMVCISWSKLTNPILIWLGKYSLEFFVVHILYMDTINVPPLNVTNNILYIVVVLILTVITMLPIEWISFKCINKVKNRINLKQK